MPIYEYECKSCGKKSSYIIFKIDKPPELCCKHCSSKELVRLLSRFATIKSEENRLSSLADPSKLSGIDESDPKSIARWMKKMGSEMGEDMGDEIDEAAEEAVKEEDAEGGEELGGE